MVTLIKSLFIKSKPRKPTIKLTPEKHEAVLNYRRQGLTYRLIEELTGISKSYVQRLCSTAELIYEHECQIKEQES